MYFAGEIENVAGNTAVAQAHYEHAPELARASGATFVTGVATVGLLYDAAQPGRPAAPDR